MYLKETSLNDETRNKIMLKLGQQLKAGSGKDGDNLQSPGLERPPPLILVHLISNL